MGHELGCHPYFKAHQRNSGASQSALGLPIMAFLYPECSRQLSSFLRLSLVKRAWAQSLCPFFDQCVQSASTHPKFCTMALLAATSTLSSPNCSSCSLSWRTGPPVGTSCKHPWHPPPPPFEGKRVAKHMASI